MATPGLDTVACCSPPCESTRVARTDAPCAQKGVRSRVHAAFALALALTLTISRYSCYTRSRGGREEREGGERDADATCAYARTHRAMAEKRQYRARVLYCFALFSRKYIRSIDLPRRKKKKNRIHLSTFSFARAKLPAK